MKKTISEKTFYRINTTFVVMISVIALFPLLHIFAKSLSGSHAIQSGWISFYPVQFTIDNYAELFRGTKIAQSFYNSVIVTIVGVVLNMVMTIFAAYPLSRRDFLGRKTFMKLIIFTMLFTGGTIPNYLLVKSLGLLDSFLAIWLPGLISAYNLMILRTNFENLPSELEESARIDGAGEWTILFKIFLPLSKPVLATLTLFYGVGLWNSFYAFILYITSPEKQNMPVMVQQMIKSQSMLSQLEEVTLEDMSMVTSEGIKSAAVFVMIIPLMLIYPFVQRYFVKGVMVGAVKG